MLSGYMNQFLTTYSTEPEKLTKKSWSQQGNAATLPMPGLNRLSSQYYREMRTADLNYSRNSQKRNEQLMGASQRLSGCGNIMSAGSQLNEKSSAYCTGTREPLMVWPFVILAAIVVVALSTFTIIFR